MDFDRELTVIQMLALIRARLGMYIDLTGNATVAYLNGFKIACAILGVIPPSRDTFEAVVSEHGWEYTAVTPVWQMQERGMDAEAIARELLAIEIEAWQRTYPAGPEL